MPWDTPDMDGSYSRALDSQTLGDTIVGNTEAALSDPNFVRGASTDAYREMFQGLAKDFASRFDFSREGIEENLGAFLTVGMAPVGGAGEIAVEGAELAEKPTGLTLNADL